MNGLRIGLCAALGMMTVGFSHPAAAAPQVLGVMASDGPVPLVCSDGVCRAEVTAFCLQEERSVPPDDTLYEPVGTAPMTLVLKRADGSTQRLDAAREVSVSSRRGFTAVTIAAPETLLARHAAVSAELEIGPNVTVAPVPVAGDPKPQSPEEIALASGPMRQLATARLEQGSAATAARLTERLINALPPQDQETAEVRSALWDTALSSASANPEAVALARRAFDGCQSALANGYTRNMRHCLELQHGAFLIERNEAFWREAAGF
jgi:hypothetical protein